ncbi:MAG TPA: hypothetical protein VJN68_00740 [Burkholderiaceae bacterium]|nr:hypothetical protein [Burkholderiaceae bacterium]
MRASPAFQCVLNRYGVWRAAVGAVAAAGIAVLLTWLATRSEPTPPLGLAAWAGAMLAVPALAASLMRLPAVTLRWDGQHWWLARLGRSSRAVAAAQIDATAGELDVALDLGAWMLLRFRPVSTDRRERRPRWLPVQRRGLEAQWHALRCAVYSPRPAPAREAADQP